MSFHCFFFAFEWTQAVTALNYQQQPTAGCPIRMEVVSASVKPCRIIRMTLRPITTGLLQDAPTPLHFQKAVPSHKGLTLPLAVAQEELIRVVSSGLS